VSFAVNVMSAEKMEMKAEKKPRPRKNPPQAKPAKKHSAPKSNGMSKSKAAAKRTEQEPQEGAA